MCVHQQVRDVVGLRCSLCAWRVVVVRCMYLILYSSTHPKPTRANTHTHTHTRHVYAHAHVQQSMSYSDVTDAWFRLNPFCMPNPHQAGIPRAVPPLPVPRRIGRVGWAADGYDIIYTASRSETNPKSLDSGVANWIWHRRR